MKDYVNNKIFENYVTDVDTSCISKWAKLISNWKSEFKNWSSLDDDIKVDEFKRWVRDELAS